MQQKAENIKRSIVFDRASKLVKLVDEFLYKDISLANSCLENLQLLLKEKPSKKYAVIYQLLRLSLLNIQDEHNSAEILFQRLNLEKLKGEKWSVRAYEEAICTALLAHKVDKALYFLKRVKKESKMTGPCLLYLAGLIKLKQEKPKSASDLFESCTEMKLENPSDRDVFYQASAFASLSKMKYNHGKYKKALIEINRAIQLCAERHISLRRSWRQLYLGKINVALGKQNKALKAYQRSFRSEEMLPSLQQIFSFLAAAQILYSKNKFRKTIDTLDFCERVAEQVKVSIPTKVWTEIYLLKAKAFAKKDKREQSLTYYAKAFQEMENLDSKFKLTQLQEMIEYCVSVSKYEEAFNYQSTYLDLINEQSSSESEDIVQRFESLVKKQKLKRSRALDNVQEYRLRLQSVKHLLDYRFLLEVFKSLSALNDHGAIMHAVESLKTLLISAEQTMEKAYVHIKYEEATIKEYLFLWSLVFQGTVESEILVDKNIELDKFGIPANLVLPFIIEILERSKNQRSQLNLTIEFNHLKEGLIQCVVEDDNGIVNQILTSDGDLPERIKTVSDKLKFLSKQFGSPFIMEVKTLKNVVSGTTIGSRLRINMPLFIS